ncbi:MAG TPA: SpoVG family protein [bacterium]|nr:SpoVG family protein [bacterium]HPN31065.1 SpoVG family protein [bacterium]
MAELNLNEIFTDVRVNRVENMNNVKAFADVVIGGNFVCKGFKVMDGQKGLWVSMPSRSTKGGQWEDIFHPITADGRAKLFELILEKFEKTPLKTAEPGQAPAKSKTSKMENSETDGDSKTDEEIPF